MLSYNMRYILSIVITSVWAATAHAQSGHDYSAVCEIYGAVYDYRQETENSQYPCVNDKSTSQKLCLHRPNSQFIEMETEFTLRAHNESSSLKKQFSPVIQMTKEEVGALERISQSVQFSRQILSTAKFEWLPRDSNPMLDGWERQIARWARKDGEDSANIIASRAKLKKARTEWKDALTVTNAEHERRLAIAEQAMIDHFYRAKERRNPLVKSHPATAYLDGMTWIEQEMPISCEGRIKRKNLWVRVGGEPIRTEYENTQTGKTHIRFHGMGRIPRTLNLIGVALSSDHTLAIALDGGHQGGRIIGLPHPVFLLENQPGGWVVIGTTADAPIFTAPREN